LFRRPKLTLSCSAEGKERRKEGGQKIHYEMEKFIHISIYSFYLLKSNLFLSILLLLASIQVFKG
jgi:hypothetical protein